MFLSNVNSKYGAPMGRREYHTDAEPLGRFSVARVRLNSGGYDNGGAYWGTGLPLYRARAFVDYTDREGLGEMVEYYIRATSRADALLQVQKRYPDAKFFRGEVV